jgi:hypothetical protein
MISSYSELQRRAIRDLRLGGSQSGEVSIFPLQRSYSDDRRISLTSVVFPPRNLAEIIDRDIVTPLRSIEADHCYYPIQSMHATIKNVRTVADPPLFDRNDVEKCREVFKCIVPRHPRFSLSLKELVPFASSISLVGYSDQCLGNLVLSLDQGLREAGVPDNKKYISDSVFFGNVTVCRYTHRPSPRFLDRACRLLSDFRQTLPVEEIHLITCNVVCSEETREVIDTFALAECSYESERG